MSTTAALLLAAVAWRAVAEEEPLRLDKCCWKSQYYDRAAGECVSAPWSVADFTREEVLEPPLAEEDARWVPPQLRQRRIHARYDVELRGHRLAVVEADAAAVAALLRVNASAGTFAPVQRYDVELRGHRLAVVEADAAAVAALLGVNASAGAFAHVQRFSPAVDARAAWGQSFCLDADAPAPRPAAVVALSGLLTRALRKCCPEGQRLDQSARACIDNPPWAVHEVGAWVPPTPWLNASGARVEVDNFGFQWNVAVRVGEEDDAVWRLTAPPAKPEFKVWVRGASRRGGGAALEGVASAYCFDAVDDGPLAPRALLAAVVKARKCCARAQRLSADARRCEPLPAPQGAGAGDAAAAAQRLGEEDAEASAWLPAAVGRALGGGAVPVLYNAAWGAEAALVLEADEGEPGAWSVEVPEDEEPVLWLERRTANGTARIRAGRSCFDARAGGGRVLVVEAPCDAASVACLPKCCPSGQLLDASGRCAEPPLRALPARDWDPAASAAAPFLAPDRVPLARFRPAGSCHARAFALHRLTPQQAAHWLEHPDVEERFMNVHRCADLQLQQAGDAVAEAFASCALPALGPAYARVRPLQLLGALLLAAALAALAPAPAPARRSVHRVARAAHAACLLLAALLQAGWFLAYRRNDDCEYVAFFTYFFLVATGSWLNVMALNLAWRCWRPAVAGGVARAGLWRRLAPWAAYGWGLPAALAAASVAAFLNREALDRAGAVSPTFFETRTCMGEHRLSLHGSSTLNMGAALYYYVPMGILMIVNVACMWCKTSREAARQKDSLLLEGKATSDISVSEMRRAQLLVLSQLAALAAEAAAWALRPQPPQGGSFVATWEGSLQSAFAFSLAATALDVARAAALLALSVDAGTWERARAHVARWRPRGHVAPAATPAVAQETVATRC